MQCVLRIHARDSTELVVRFIGFSGFTANPTKMEMNMLVPVASLIGGYKINGKVLILPIQGEGASNMTMGKLTDTCLGRIPASHTHLRSSLPSPFSQL